ncbi:hypothetical protein P7C70_g6326, partial [Phenoliferia sp. Uapishka_3]
MLPPQSYTCRKKGIERKKKEAVQPPSAARFAFPPEIVQLVVDQVSQDFGDDWTTSYPRNFLDLALVSHAFAAAVQLCVYEHPTLKGRDLFLYFTGKIRTAPHLGILVRHATLESAPHDQLREDDSVRHGVHPITVQALRWFLEAVPNLSSLNLQGFEALSAACSPTLAATLGRLRFFAVSGHPTCASYLNSKPKWLLSLLALPGLEQLFLTDIPLSTRSSYILSLPPSDSFQSTITTLSFDNFTQKFEGDAIARIVALCPNVSHLTVGGDLVPGTGLENALESMKGRLMSASLVAAATAGIVLGVGATVLLTPARRAPPPSSSSSAAPPQSYPSPSSPSSAFPSPSGAPPSVYNGALTTVSALPLSLGSIGPISDFIRRQAYTTAYDRRNRIPAWTAEHLTKASLKKPQAAAGSEGGGKSGGDRSNSTFREDETIPPMFRAHLLNYFKSGYDRGHMVPAADAKMSQTAMDETFILSNIAPQVGEGFNRHYWAYVEAFCRNLTSSFDDVYVFTVPLFLPRQSPDGKWRVTYEMIAPQNAAPTIAVPTHFAKVIITSSAPRSSSSLSLVSTSNSEKKDWTIGAFVLPNEVISDNAPLTSFLVPGSSSPTLQILSTMVVIDFSICSIVEAVESSAGLTLVPEGLKAVAKPLCKVRPLSTFEVVARRFDDAQKKVTGGKGGRGRSASV